MDKVAKYREYIITLLTRYASEDISDNDVEVQLILDTERDHYQWMNVGWQQFNRIYRCVMHFDIKDGKIWLQQNLTDQNPAEELVEMGVPREDIVLGLQPPTNGSIQIMVLLEKGSCAMSDDKACCCAYAHLLGWVKACRLCLDNS